MTITTQDLIDAARAIGIEDITVIRKHGVIFYDHAESGQKQWQPQHDKSQLFDLYYRLKLDVNFFPHGAGYINDLRLVEFIRFDETFESFTTAIILAAAEIGRGKQ